MPDVLGYFMNRSRFAPLAGFYLTLGEVAIFAFGRCYCLVSQRFLRPEIAELSGDRVVKNLIPL
jgi:hypothetical protein